MARFGQWRPLGPDWDAPGRARLTPDIIGLHTMVTGLTGCDAMFRRNGYGGVHSHFGIGGDGTTYQWQDTRYRAAANLDGNHRIVSVETADHGPEFLPWDTRVDAVPRWTDAQVTRLAALVAALCEAHAIPCELIPDSRPGRRGIGYHRQGCDGSYADGRVPGGELWSSARGKVCPGNARIAQIPTVIARARAILVPPAEDDMQLSDRLPDLFTGVPDDSMSVGGSIAWACAHAAFARRDAAAALATAERIEAKLDQLWARLAGT